LINISIDNCHFPKRLKEAQVVPLFKKKDPLTKSKYRPVSILPIPSKKVEKVLSEQLSLYFDKKKYICFGVHSTRAMVAKQYNIINKNIKK
jgi:predicted alternative tryptophan synthase beta-subunit